MRRLICLIAAAAGLTAPVVLWSAQTGSPATPQVSSAADVWEEVATKLRTPADLLVEHRRIRQLAANRNVEQFVIGETAPQKERQPRGLMVPAPMAFNRLSLVRDNSIPSARGEWSFALVRRTKMEMTL